MPDYFSGTGKERESEELMKRLHEMGKKFTRLYASGEYGKAKHCYDTARTVACFFGLAEDEMNEVFGSREKEITGVFPEDIVQRVFYHTSIKGNEDSTDESLADNELKHMQRRLLGLYAKK